MKGETSTPDEMIADRHGDWTLRKGYLTKACPITDLGRGDVAEVSAIERACFVDPWTEDQFLKVIDYGLDFRGIWAEGRLAGYAVGWPERRVYRLANLAVAEQFRRQGLGTQLIRDVFKTALSNKCREVRLEVRRSNLVGRSFYRKHGFAVAATLSGYYRNGEDALVMKRKLVHYGRLV